MAVYSVKRFSKLDDYSGEIIGGAGIAGTGAAALGYRSHALGSSKKKIAEKAEKIKASEIAKTAGKEKEIRDLSGSIRKGGFWSRISGKTSREKAAHDKLVKEVRENTKSAIKKSGKYAENATRLAKRNANQGAAAIAATGLLATGAALGANAYRKHLKGQQKEFGWVGSLGSKFKKVVNRMNGTEAKKLTQQNKKLSGLNTDLIKEKQAMQGQIDAANKAKEAAQSTTNKWKAATAATGVAAVGAGVGGYALGKGQQKEFTNIRQAKKLLKNKREISNARKILRGLPGASTELKEKALRAELDVNDAIRSSAGEASKKYLKKPTAGNEKALKLLFGK